MADAFAVTSGSVSLQLFFGSTKIYQRKNFVTAVMVITGPANTNALYLRWRKTGLDAMSVNDAPIASG